MECPEGRVDKNFYTEELRGNNLLPWYREEGLKRWGIKKIGELEMESLVEGEGGKQEMKDKKVNHHFC